MRQLTILACIVSAAGAALAMSEAARQADADGNGVLTLDEVQATFPDVSEGDFMAMDLNADGTLDEREVTAAEEAGMLPAIDRGG